MAFVSGPVDSTDAHAWNFIRLHARLPGAGRTAGQPACTKFSMYAWERGLTLTNAHCDLLWPRASRLNQLYSMDTSICNVNLRDPRHACVECVRMPAVRHLVSHRCARAHTHRGWRACTAMDPPSPSIVSWYRQYL